MKWTLPAFLIFCVSCSDVREPAYLTIQHISLKNSGQGETSISSAINDAWIYVDGSLIGAFELPCRIPVSKLGKHSLSLAPGIWVNGLNTLRNPYIFYTVDEQTLTFEAGQSIQLSPTVSYKDNIRIAYQADFDSPTGNTLEATLQSDTTGGITNQPDLVFEGAGSFRARYFKDEGFIELQQTEPINLPKSGAIVFLELNYMSSHPLQTGVRSFYPSAGSVYSPVTSLPATQKWQKVYINLTHAVSTEVNAQNYRAVFRVNKLPGTAELDLRLDNIRIICFQS